MHSAMKRFTRSPRLTASLIPCNSTLQLRLTTVVVSRSFVATSSVLVQSSFPTWATTTSSSMRSSQLRRFSSYPNHTVVPMPALSPTMETGSIAKWTLKEGDRFEAGTGSYYAHHITSQHSTSHHTPYSLYIYIYILYTSFG